MFGIEVDLDRNASASEISKRAGTAMISSAFSRVSIMVVRADEEGEIALQSVATAGLIKDEQHSTGMEVTQSPLRTLRSSRLCCVPSLIRVLGVLPAPVPLAPDSSM